MTSSLYLDKRVAVVTGCGQPNGIGVAIARALRACGAITVLTDRQVPSGVSGYDQLDKLASELGEPEVSSLALRGDVSSEVDCDKIVSTVVQKFGRVDILVNNAAADHGGDRLPAAQVTLADWQRVLNVNLTGAFLMSRAAIPVMTNQKWGRIINISSVAALRGLENRTAYSASKAGLLGLTRALAAELVSFGVTVNAVCPGAVETRRAESTAMRDNGPGAAEARIAARAKSIPVGRMGQGSDIANAVTFLAAPASDFITGQVFPVDGGSVAIAGKYS